MPGVSPEGFASGRSPAREVAHLVDLHPRQLLLDRLGELVALPHVLGRDRVEEVAQAPLLDSRSLLLAGQLKQALSVKAHYRVRASGHGEGPLGRTGQSRR